MKKIFVIGEIGINHNGDINLAKKLIDQACKARFDAVKFQKRDIDLVYKKEFLDSARESPWGNTQRDQKLGLEFDKKEFDEISNYCKEKKIIWFCSAWDINSLKFLDNYNLNYHKIASAMIVDKNFLREVAKRKKHTFISTGMSTKKDIDEAVKIFREEKCSFELMHCVSLYPLDINKANLKRISTLKNEYGCDVGYSGHESTLSTSYAAAMMGITSLERHITLDRSMYGSDQSASIEYRGMVELVNVIEKMSKSLTGDGMINNFLEEEFPIAKKLREHIKDYDVDKHFKML